MSHDHHHNHDHPQDETAAPPLDAANQSLSDALQVSFRLLSVIMLVVLVALLCTGMTQINPGQRGVALLFGRIQGDGDQRVLGEGLKWSWPEPAGRVLKVETDRKKLEINDFWFHETPEEAVKELDKKTVTGGELRPGWDGALLTGDRGLIHVKLVCWYNFAAGPAGPAGDAIMDYLQRAGDARNAQELVRSAVCAAAIQAAAERTVDAIQTTGQADFRGAVAELAQQRLAALGLGLTIQSIEIPGTPTVPLAARPAFNAATAAKSEQETVINNALGEAVRTLASACGASYKKLAGDPKDPADAGLLARYAQARERGDEAAAGALLAEIHRLLESNETTGQAAGILNEANGYSTTIVQRTQARADSFRQFLDSYRTNPELTIQRLWANAKEEILANPKIAKYYLTPDPKTVLRINADPKVERRIQEEMLRAEKRP
jgi:regulator of protease activity HflC (stomatin/prohibitin superfamily)